MMYLILFLVQFMHNSTSPNWLTDFNQAKLEAKVQHKYILLSFSGSDWCVPCIKMKRDYFSSQQFIKYSEKNLILVNADFPRKKKNKLPDTIKTQNEILAAQYNKNAIFPMTILLNDKAEIIKTWEGLPKVSAEQFLQELSLIK